MHVAYENKLLQCRKKFEGLAHTHVAIFTPGLSSGDPAPQQQTPPMIAQQAVRRCDACNVQD